MSNLSISISLSELDCSEYEYIQIVIRGLTKILDYQFFPKLSEWSVTSENEVHLSFRSYGSHQKIEEKYSNYSVKRPLPYILDSVQIDADGSLHGKSLSLTKLFCAKKFRDLAKSKIDVSSGVPFAVPVYDVSILPSNIVQDLRNEILEMYYEGLKEIGEYLNSDLCKLEAAYEKVKSESWFIESSIGSVVEARGKVPFRAQLIAKWTPDYIYHYARIFDQDGLYSDMLFMIYWRLIGGEFFDNPGKLSWVDSSTLSFIPKKRDEYRILFKIDDGPIDFSYYFEEPRRRANKFYSHLIDEIDQSGANTVRMNF